MSGLEAVVLLKLAGSSNSISGSPEIRALQSIPKGSHGFVPNDPTKPSECFFPNGELYLSSQVLEYDILFQGQNRVERRTDKKNEFNYIGPDPANADALWKNLQAKRRLYANKSNHSNVTGQQEHGQESTSSTGGRSSAGPSGT